jgi:hypothetical protein
VGDGGGFVGDVERALDCVGGFTRSLLVEALGRSVGRPDFAGVDGTGGTVVEDEACVRSPGEDFCVRNGGFFVGDCDVDEDGRGRRFMFIIVISNELDYSLLSKSQRE